MDALSFPATPELGSGFAIVLCPSRTKEPGAILGEKYH